MESTVGSVLIIVTTLILGLGVFTVYNTVFVPQYSKVSLNEQAIAISKTTSIYVSSLTGCHVAFNQTVSIDLKKHNNMMCPGQCGMMCQGQCGSQDMMCQGQCGSQQCKQNDRLQFWILNYKGAPFKSAFLITVDSPLTQVVLVPFVAKPNADPFYTLPGPSQNASIAKITSNSYTEVPSVAISNKVINIPQYGSIGPVTVKGYKVYTNTSYVLVANATPSSVIIVWVLANLNGEWYRVGYAYIKPSGEGMGMYASSLTGLYKLFTGSLDNPTPHIALSNKGTQIGLWFMPVMYSPKPSPLVNITFVPTGTCKKIFSVVFYTVNSSLYFNVTDGPGSKPIINNVLVYNKLKVGNWYFLNFSLGAINAKCSDAKTIKVTIYNISGHQLNQVKGTLPYEINGYTLMIRYGSSYAANAITQSFGETLHDNNPTTLAYFYAVSSVILKYGPLANYTYALNYTIANSGHSMDGLFYVFAVSPCQMPSASPDMILWYYPQGGGIGSYKYPNSTVIKAVGSYSYIGI
ncbi:MAG: hypothetical protein ACP5HQ_01135 [Thermoprotei archaeon]